jgi:dTDP-4-amino-4,6-dideoxygalactose transaminase
MSYARHVYTVYTIRSERRAELRQQLERAGVQTAIHYPIPVHLQPAYADLGYRAGDFPVSEEAAREVLALPIFPEMTENQLHSVVEVFTAARAQVK